MKTSDWVTSPPGGYTTNPAPGCIVEYQMRRDMLPFAQCESEKLRWTHDSNRSSDIVRWRIVSRQNTDCSNISDQDLAYALRTLLSQADMAQKELERRGFTITKNDGKVESIIKRRWEDVSL